MSALKPECDTIGQKEPSHKKGRHGKSSKQRPTESNEQTKHTLTQCSERYHKLRKAITQEERNPSEEAMRLMAIQEQAKK